jgi:Lon protease-like protein
MDLPTLIPLFPLPNVVLFPGVPLPLHIFEPRYRQMVEDARTEDALIGMMLLRDDWPRDYYGRPATFGVGCAGRMVNVEPLADGRFNILLHGLREFSVISEDATRAYRRGNVRWRSAPNDTSIGPDRRDRIKSLLEHLLPRETRIPLRKLLLDAAVGDELFVNFVCYALDLLPVEKQGLLESTDLGERADHLGDVLEFRVQELRATGKSTGDRGRFH